MKESAVLQTLEEIADHLKVKVSSVNLNKCSYSVTSGLCRVKGEYRVIVDKHLHLSEKIDVLIEALLHLDADAFSTYPDINKIIEKKVSIYKNAFLQKTEPELCDSKKT